MPGPEEAILAHSEEMLHILLSVHRRSRSASENNRKVVLGKKQCVYSACVLCEEVQIGTWNSGPVGTFHTGVCVHAHILIIHRIRPTY